MTGVRPARADTAEVELARARAAYRASLAALRAWRAISPSARHPDAACRCLLGALFAEPGLHRTALVGRIAECAGRRVRYFRWAVTAGPEMGCRYGAAPASATAPRRAAAPGAVGRSPLAA